MSASLPPSAVASPASSKPTSPAFSAISASFEHTVATLISKQEWHSLLILAEQRELMDGGVLGKDAELYMAVQMLAAALTDDLKRTPVDLRTRSSLLTNLWQLLAALLTHDSITFFTRLHTLPPRSLPPPTSPLTDLLAALHRRTRRAACEQLEAVYDTIEVDEARRTCDAAHDDGEWQQLVQQRGWQVDGDFVRLRRRAKERGSAVGLEELDRLTRYVTELEQ